MRERGRRLSAVVPLLCSFAEALPLVMALPATAAILNDVCIHGERSPT